MSIDLKQLLDRALGEGTWVAYCINLERAAERREHFSKWAASVNLPFEWWVATDKKKLTEDDWKLCHCKHSQGPDLGPTACRASHHKLYNHLLATYPQESKVQWFFILEDDAGFAHPEEDAATLTHFLHSIALIKDQVPFEMLHFGYHMTGLLQLQPINANIAHVIATHLTHAMVLSRRTVKNVLLLCDQENLKHLPIDWITDALRRTKVDEPPPDRFPVCLTLGPLRSVIHQVEEYSYLSATD